MARNAQVSGDDDNDNRDNANGGGNNHKNIEGLALAFHAYICQHATVRQQATDREGAHLAFVAFYQQNQQAQQQQQKQQQDPQQENDVVNNQSKKKKKKDKKNKHLEALVMARMRRLRLLRSKRYGNNVVTIFANADKTFPSVEERASIRQQKIQEQADLEQNKHGVSVLLRQEEAQQTSQLGTLTTFHFFGKLDHQFDDDDDDDDATTANKVQLESITLQGSHRRMYKVEVPFALPWSIHDDPATRAFTVTVKPHQIGVFRCRVHCNFTLQQQSLALRNDNDDDDDNKVVRTSFAIARSISTKGTMNAAMDQALQPKEVYQRRKRPKNRSANVKQVLMPDNNDDDENDGGGKKNNNKKKKKKDFNPFEKLPRYAIPKDVRDLLDGKEMDQILEPPQVSGTSTDEDNDDDNDNEGGDNNDNQLEGYATFWKNLLWASEHQAHADIELYDLEQVPLQQEGRDKYLLTVPGLAENRPSVLLGDMVKVYFRKTLYMGKVTQVRLLQVCLSLNGKFGRDFDARVDRVDVRFCLSRTTYRTAHFGMEQAEASMRATMLAPLLTSTASSTATTTTGLAATAVTKTTATTAREDETPLMVHAPLKWANRTLNPEQQAAVHNVLAGAARPLPYCIFGPPGTGKTTTLIETVYQLAMTRQARILLVAPSNDAADILVERLATYFPPSELKRILAYSRSIDLVPAAIRNYVVESAPSNLHNKKEHAQCREIMAGRIVVATVNLAARFCWMGVPTGHFDVLCVDEAGHATEPEVVSMAATIMQFFAENVNEQQQQQGGGENAEGAAGIAASTVGKKTGQLVLAGDPRQLGPVVTSEVCRQFGLQVSYMERLMNTTVYGRQTGGKYPEELVTKLVRNYRSHPSIIKLPNEQFYDGELICSADPMVSHNLAQWEYLPAKGFPILFHAMDGENQREGNSPSWFNPQEAMQVVQYVKLLTSQTRPPLKADDIGIITPYHRQAQKIRMALQLEAVVPNGEIKVGSVETFQGQERRCIIVSTVRAQAEHVESDLRYNLGFVANEKRFNVAVTRAKALLIVVGCPSVLALDKENWLPFLQHCHENKAWAGEEWDPNQVDDDDDHDDDNDYAAGGSATPKDDEEKNEDENAKIGAVEEGFAFIHREE